MPHLWSSEYVILVFERYHELRRAFGADRDRPIGLQPRMMQAAILALHIGMGTLGLLSGAATLLFRKGAGPHRAAGTVFVLAMLFMAASASVLAAMKSLPDLAVGGILTIYLIATAWMAARRKDGETGAFEIGAFVAAIACGLGMFSCALLVAFGTMKAKNPYIVTVYYSFSGVMALAAVADLSVTLRRGIAGAQRIARHLWRMCAGLIIAVGSFAAQGAKVLPPAVGSQVLFASMILVLIVMLFWLVRVLFTNWYRQAEQAP